MTSILVIDTADFPQLVGQDAGRELELELTAIVTKIAAEPVDGGSPSSRVTLIPVRVDITQTT